MSPSLTELRTCGLSRLFVAAYTQQASSGCGKRRRAILSWTLRAENGEMFSATARHLLAAHHGLRIGAYSYGCFDPQRFPNGVTIDRFVSIGPDVRVFRRNHPLDRLSLHPFFYNPGLGISKEDAIDSRPLEIGPDAWIGARTLILPGCGRIGCGAVVGAGAVVTHDVPDFAVVVGNPARVVKMRFANDLAKRVLAWRWWERPIHELRDFLHEMQIPLNSMHPLLNSQS